jgi:AcrR family transcriptional regulator
MAVKALKSAGRRRTQAERSSETRGKAIAATILVLLEQGFAGTSTPAIALRAGISRGALSHQFATKADLLVAVVDHLVERFLERFAIEDGRRPLAARVEQIVDRAWAIYGSDDYLAMLNVVFGAVGDTQLTARLQERFARIERELPRVWRRTFDHLDLSEDRLQLGLLTLIVQMRGMALDRGYGRAPRQPEKQLALLKTVIRRHLEGTLSDRNK